ncbi:hypothetical protein W97_04059 [Coniosporium apollinis CBS 100218]|uniref:Uncharacterized protein n=1 Tax=Coniosporium apollinis (strain CBS 100218) TaxID=1168221 RepID=R7YSE3_CONA1|nr:uncharacterized protein W97_04059 [Coniosporium apollinis CBS 100218]EON64825.1 hypothetical protein W97_04059 [Coniosporium apollinis CBS 100218]
MRIYVIAAVSACFGATVLSQSLGNLSESVTEGCTEASPARASHLFSGICLKDSRMSVSIADATLDSAIAARDLDTATTDTEPSSSDPATQTLTATLYRATAASSAAYGGLLVDTGSPKTETTTSVVFTDDKGATKPPLGASTTSKSGTRSASPFDGVPPAFGMVRLGLVTLGMCVMAVVFAEL